MDLETIENKNIPVLFFDAECLLCSKSIAFILSREKNDSLFFSSLKSGLAKELGLKSDFKSQIPESIILYHNKQIFKESTAALRATCWLKIPSNWLSALVIIPRFIRDPIYRWVSRNRYKWYGKIEDGCSIIPARYQYRVLD